MIEHSKSTIGEREKNAVLEVIKSNYLSEGEIVHKFEEELSEYIGSKGAVATSTGTLALHLALVSLNINSTDEVIIPSYVCCSVLNAVLYCGARPVLCDVNENDYNISFEYTKKKITRKTKAIIVPHMFGCPAQIDKFKELGIHVIEDCAHSIGAEYKNKKVGSFGDLSIFSFEGTKYIITGEGGMVLANSKTLLNKLRALKNPDSLFGKVKYTYRMTNMQAAIGRTQLSQLGNFIKRRKQITSAYGKAFSGMNIELPRQFTERSHVFHRYMIKIKHDIIIFMSECYRRGVKVKQPIKPHPLHKYLNLPARMFPNTEHIMKSAVSIPIYPSITDKEIEFIVTVINKSLFK